MWEVFQSLPVWYQYSLLFAFGAITGSFLDVLTSRFRTGRSINGRSHCCSCGHNLGWYELVPVISYLVLRGRCRRCHAIIPARLLLFELLTGLLFLIAYLASTSWLQLGLHLALVSVLLIITSYDIKHFIIPNQLVLVVSGLVLVLLGTEVVGWDALWQLWPHAVTAVGTFAFFGGLWLVSKGRWLGFGDAKLAAPLALLIGPWPSFSFVVLSFWVGAVISVGLLTYQYLRQRGQNRLPFASLPRTIKSEVPFAPFMVIAWLLVYFFGADVLMLLSTLVYV